MAQARKKFIRQETPPTAAAAAKGGAQRWQPPALCLALAAITFAVFGQTLRHQFVDFDDSHYVYDNPVVARGLTLQGILWAFAQAHSSNWHPLTWLSHMLDCQLYGLNPGGHHLTNVLLHTATVIALFLVLRQMTGALWRSAFVAAVFAIHPLRVESVAWVAERKDVLSGLFFMLTLGAYVRYARRPWSRGRYGLVMLLFALGLMCKPMLVTLPLLLLLLDYWPLQRAEPAGSLLREKLPLLALSAAGSVATLWAQSGAMQQPGELFSLPLRLANALVSCAVYLGQMVWPAGLAVFYPFPQSGLPPGEVALAAMLLGGLSAAAFWQRPKRPWLLMGWLWYLVMLLPVAGIIQVGGQAHADRYTYLPQIGIYVALTWLAAEWGGQWRAGRAVLGVLMTATLAVLAVCAWKQTAHWQDSESLWAHTVDCTAGNGVAHNNLGNVLRREGRLGQAISQYEKALASKPDYAEAHLDIGLAFFQLDRVDEAIVQYQKAVEIEPGLAEAHLNLGNLLVQRGRMDDAITHYQKALASKPDYPEARLNLGLAFFRQGRMDEAISQYQKALEIKPDYAGAHMNLGNSYYQLGRIDEAIAQFQKAVAIRPDSAEARYNLGNSFAQAGRTAEAISQYEKAADLAGKAHDPAGGNYPILLRTLAAGYAKAGRFADATRTAQQALDLARTAGREDWAAQLNGDLQRYQAGLPLPQ